MLDVRRLRPDDWPTYRALRLAALADEPGAFCSTLARESAFPDTLWRERLERAEPDAAHPLVATLAGEPRALAWAMTSRRHEHVAELFQMWVAPEARGRGVGGRLVEECVDWARSRGHTILTLGCARDNASAMRLYERHGFVATGELEPLREGSDSVIEWMERPLAAV